MLRHFSLVNYMPPPSPQNEITAQDAGLWLAARRGKRKAEDVAIAIGASPGYYSTLEHGKTDWRKSKYSDLIVFELGISADELLSIGAYRLARLASNAQPPPLLLEPTVKHKTDIVVLPVRALADAGTPHETAHSDLGDYIMPREHYRNGLEIFVADGQSMRKTDIEGIQDQDTLIVDVQDYHLRDNKVYVVCDEAGGYTVKRARDWNGQWWLTSDNSKFAPFQLAEARVVGRVVKVESERDF